MRVSLQFLWYDLWIGAYYDRAKRTLYVCPLPCVVFKFSPAAGKTPDRTHRIHAEIFDTRGQETANDGAGEG